MKNLLMRRGSIIKSMQEQGNYHVWLLMYVADARSDLLVLALDGDVQPLEEQYSHGGNLLMGHPISITGTCSRI